MQIPAYHRPTIRSDAAGEGNFLASRGERVHFGVDYLAPAGTKVCLERPATFIKEGIAYASTTRYKYVEFRDRDFYIRYFYVAFGALNWGRGHNVAAGTVFGTMQDIADHYPDSGMHNHCHLTVHKLGAEGVDGFKSVYHAKKDRTYFDPEDYLDGKL